MKSLTVVAYGSPAPQGSKNIYKGNVVEQSKALPPWRQAVTYAARNAMAEAGDWEPFVGPVTIVALFAHGRPKGHYGTGRNSDMLKPSAPAYYKGTAPDLSKLIRAVEDALTDAGVWGDDCIVVKIEADKHYCDPGIPPGVTITINELSPDASR